MEAAGFLSLSTWCLLSQDSLADTNASGTTPPPVPLSPYPPALSTNAGGITAQQETFKLQEAYSLKGEPGVKTKKYPKKEWV